MKKIILVLMTLFLSGCFAFPLSAKETCSISTDGIKNVEIVIIKKRPKINKRTLSVFPEVYLNKAEYRLYVIHSQNGDMGTFRIEDPSGMIEHSDSYKADGSTNEFSLPPFLSGPYTIILECGGEEYEGEFVI